MNKRETLFALYRLGDAAREAVLRVAMNQDIPSGAMQIRTRHGPIYIMEDGAIVIRPQLEPPMEEIVMRPWSYGLYTGQEEEPHIEGIVAWPPSDPDTAICSQCNRPL